MNEILNSRHLSQMNPNQKDEKWMKSKVQEMPS